MENNDEVLLSSGSDLESVATEESQWLFVDTDAGAEPDDSEDEWQRTDNCGLSSPLGESAMFLSVAEDEAQGILQVPPASCAKPIAQLVAAAQLSLPHTDSAIVWEGFRGDITCHWQEALACTPSVSSAFCLGRVAVLPVGERNLWERVALVLGRVVVRNAGLAPWPANTTLRIVAGEAFGFEALTVGALPAGHMAELVLDLALPAHAKPGAGGRSAWVLEDGHGNPFGPLLVLEVLWQ